MGETSSGLGGLARKVLGSSYFASKRVALLRMSRRRGAPTVVFSMGKTGSTAVARAIQEATGVPVFQVFRLDAARLREAERRYRQNQSDARAHGGGTPGLFFPGAQHLWESEHLLRHPPTPAAPWTIITTVREPVAQAVSAFFHATRRANGLAAGATPEWLAERFSAQAWLREPLRWFEREFNAVLGLDVMSHAFDTQAGHSVIDTPSLHLLLLRQENLESAHRVLADFLGVTTPLEGVHRRNEGATGRYAKLYRDLLAAIRLPERVLDEVYTSSYARHFYGNEEITGFRQRWALGQHSSEPGPEKWLNEH